MLVEPEAPERLQHAPYTFPTILLPKVSFSAGFTGIVGPKPFYSCVLFKNQRVPSGKTPEGPRLGSGVDEKQILGRAQAQMLAEQIQERRNFGRERVGGGGGSRVDGRNPFRTAVQNPWQNSIPLQIPTNYGVNHGFKVVHDFVHPQ